MSSIRLSDVLNSSSFDSSVRSPRWIATSKVPVGLWIRSSPCVSEMIKIRDLMCEAMLWSGAGVVRRSALDLWWRQLSLWGMFRDQRIGRVFRKVKICRKETNSGRALLYAAFATENPREDKRARGQDDGRAAFLVV
jgi:hypothetical protein